MVKSYPNGADSVAGALLLILLVVFVVALQVAKIGVDYRKMAELSESKKPLFFSRMMPPVAVLKENWRFTGRIRDYCLGLLLIDLLYFIIRGFFV